MRWRVSRRSENVEDRRGEGSSMSMGLGGVRLGGAGLVAALLLALVLGVDPTILLQGIPTGSLPGSTPEAGAERAPRSAEEEELALREEAPVGQVGSAPDGPDPLDHRPAARRAQGRHELPRPGPRPAEEVASSRREGRGQPEPVGGAEDEDGEIEMALRV